MTWGAAEMVRIAFGAYVIARIVSAHYQGKHLEIPISGRLSLVFGTRKQNLGKNTMANALHVVAAC